MTKRIYWIILFMLGCFTSIYSQSKDSSLLWEISGNGLKEKSYIFGTMHMMCAENFEIKAKVKRAFNDVKQMSFEIDMSDASEIMAMQDIMYSEKAISSQLNADAIRKMDSILMEDYQLDLKTVDHWPGINIISLMLNKAANCRELEYYDLVLLQMGLQERKKIIGLEKVSQQFKIVEKLYTAEGILSELEQLVKYKEDFGKLVELYLAEDINGLLDSFKEGEYKEEQVEKELLLDRNLAWSKKIPTIIEVNSTMIVVGAAHLAGENGVLQLLKNQGYNVTPVLDNK